MAKAVYVNRGDIVAYTATAKAVAYHDVVAFTGGIGVAVQDIPKDTTGTVAIVGAFALPKATGEIKQGATVYYKEEDGNIVAASGAGAVPAGVSLEAATADATSVVVRIG